MTAALGLLPLLLAAACGSPTTAGSATSAPSAAASVRASFGAPDAVAQARLTAAVRTMQALRSYAFSAVQTVGSQHAAQSLLSGRAVRPSSVSYRLVANGKQSEIVRLPANTYLRMAGGRWSRLRHPAAAVDPVASLVTLLKAISGPRVVPAPSGSMSLRGAIPAAAAHSAGLPARSGNADVTVVLDALHRVSSITIRTIVTPAGKSPLVVTLLTSYSSFNAIPPVKAPL